MGKASKQTLLKRKCIDVKEECGRMLKVIATQDHTVRLQPPLWCPWAADTATCWRAWGECRMAQPPRKMPGQALPEFDISYPISLEKEMTTHSSILAWKIPRAEDAGGLQRV